MPLKEHAYSVLIVSSSDKFSADFTSLLQPSVYNSVTVAKSVNAARREINERLYDIVIINSPLTDDTGVKFAVDISANLPSAVMLLVKGEIYHSVYDVVMDFGVFVLRKPAPSQIIVQSLDHLKAMRERLRKLEKKTVTLKDKMDEIKIVNHAKWVLIESLGMTEEAAHKYIEKQAMDRCVSRREIAENIIATYR